MSDYERLLEAVRQRTGVNCADYSETFLKRRFQTRLRATQLDDYESYRRLLIADDAESVACKNELMINVTSFFRDASVWSFFREKVVPELIDRKRREGRRRIKVWSAGCSSGNEAYSCVMCFLDYLGSRANEFDLRVVGTDLDPVIVQKARDGLYDVDSLKDTPQDFVEKYFEVVGSSARVVASVKRFATFQLDNILTMDIPSGVDIVFCRNTVIYFTQEAKQAFYVRVFEHIDSGTYFIMGKTETLLGTARELFSTVSNIEKIYQKALGGAS